MNPYPVCLEQSPERRALQIWRPLAALALAALAGCSLLRPSATQPPTFYALDTPAEAAASDAVARSLPGGITLLVTPPQAASGFDSPRIIYMRHPHQLEYFSASEWVDPPAQMLGPLLATALERTGAFGAVVLSPASASGDQRLDTHLIRLQHSFQTSPSRVQVALRATWVDDRTRQVLAVREFQSDVAALEETARGGVVAANAAAQQVLTQLAQWMASTTPSPPARKTGTATVHNPLHESTAQTPIPR